MALAAVSAAAEPSLVTSSVNLRQGPGTDFGITTTIPRGAIVEVVNCSGEWCTVHWRGTRGYAIARNLDLGAGGPAIVRATRVYVEPAPVIVGGPVYIGPRYGGPRYYGGWGRGYRRW
jgi:uncharacterized protein YraI